MSYRLALEGLPQDGSIIDLEVCLSSARSQLARRDIVDIHDTDHIVFTIAAALQVCKELIS